MLSNRPKTPAGWFVVVASVGPALYWTFTQSGPFRFLMNLEQDKLGFSSDRLTALALMFALFLPMRFALKLREDGRVRDPGVAETAPVRRTESAAKSALIAGGAAAFMIALGAWLYLRAEAIGPLVPATVEQFARGEVRDGSYVELDAETGRRALSITKGTGKSLYVPLAGAPVVVSLDGSEDGKAWVGNHVRARGVVSRGLDNVLRDDLARVDIQMPGDGWLVSAEYNPRFERWLALGMAVLGVLIGAFAYVVRRRVLGAA